MRLTIGMLVGKRKQWWLLHIAVAYRVKATIRDAVVWCVKGVTAAFVTIKIMDKEENAVTMSQPAAAVTAIDVAVNVIETVL